jgi:hypothetical protein
VPTIGEISFPKLDFVADFVFFLFLKTRVHNRFVAGRIKRSSFDDLQTGDARVFVEIDAVNQAAARVAVGGNRSLSDGNAARTPSTFSISLLSEMGKRIDSEPLIPGLPEAQKNISAPTFASRVARSRIVPFDSPTVKTISKTPTAMPKMLTAVRAGR